jgi:hypothetical protein
VTSRLGTGKSLTFFYSVGEQFSHTNPVFYKVQYNMVEYTDFKYQCIKDSTAKTKCRKFETNIPRKGISGPQSQFPHSCVCERIIYSHDGSAFFCWRKYVDRSWEYINRSQTHECGNWPRYSQKRNI